MKARRIKLREKYTSQEIKLAEKITKQLDNWMFYQLMKSDREAV